jgi:aspartate kinase
VSTGLPRTRNNAGRRRCGWTAIESPLMGLVVQKFGGTSVADAMKIHRAARRAIRARLADNDVVMVVSAMGDTTDRLFALAHEVCRKPAERELDVLVTTGEQVSIALMAMAIHEAGHEAISLTGAQLGLMTDSVHTRARIRSINADRIARELAAGRVVIVAGYQGVDASGEITALGRGASDLTAVALAAVLGAELCEIYTDVDGVYTTDPRIVPQARRIDTISYDEMLELAALGAGVMHSRAIEFAWKYSVPIHVRSSLTDAPGTYIVPETRGMEEVVVRGATLKRDLTLLTLARVPNTPGLAARIFEQVAGRNIVVEDIVQSVLEHGETVNIGFTVEEGHAEEARLSCEAVAGEAGIQGIEVRPHMCKVSVVGVGMRSHSGVANRMFSALAAGGINIESISTSEIVISCIVADEVGERALQLVHDAFELGKLNTDNQQP